ncbi:Gfo/Idh/MocA family oxidoreductase [Bacillus taeanensis]|uniref:Gfo/Idh/MocA family protein n=1 Tax=Bacillus taeanensis TaxID=273032 RepID=UPI00319DF2F4
MALLSRWHVHAEDYAQQAEENEQISIQLVWDENSERGKKWAEELGVPFEADLTAVLSNPSIDAVIVSGPTKMHKEIIMAAASYQKHIFTEKVLAFTVQDCDDIFSAVEKANVQLMISLPRLIEDYYLYAQKVVDKGWLGKLSMVRCRVAHNGAVSTEEHPDGWLPKSFFNRENCGGGAFIDLGAHPIYLANRLAGTSKAVTARLQSMLNHDVDDHAAALVEYESGTLAVIETSFLSSGSPFQLEVYGTEGTLLIEENHIRLKSSKFDINEWIVPEQLPDPLPMPMEQWISAITEGTTPTITKEDARNLTLINQAAALSHKEERRVDLNELI